MILIVICNVRRAPPLFVRAAVQRVCQLDLQHVNSSISPKIHASTVGIQSPADFVRMPTDQSM